MSIRKTRWVNVARRGKSHPVLFMDSVVELYKRGYFGKAHDVRWNPRCYRQYDDARWFGDVDILRYQRFMEKAAGRKKGGLLDYACKFENRLKAFRKFSEDYHRTDFSKYSNKQLADVFIRWFEHTKLIWSFAYDYIFINKFLPDKINAVVAATVHDLHKQNKYLGIIFQAETPSEIVLEKRNLIFIAKKLRERKIQSEDIIKKEMLKKHVMHFAHLGFYYFRGKPFSLDDIKFRLSQYLKLSSVKFHEIVTDVKNQNKNRKATHKIITQLNLNREVTQNIKEIKKWSWISSFQDETYAYVIYNLFPLWLEISRRLKMRYSQFYSLTASEIMRALADGCLSEKLKHESTARHLNHAIILENGQKRILIGAKLASYRKKEKAEKTVDRNIKILYGQSASLGFAKGCIKTVFSIHDIERVNRGDIIVAFATNPSFIPAMEKAAAIITDEGGLLSHAAIVSRELKIPCIVGTKIATKVFKDGDLVEVDANEGIIKKL